MKVLVAVLLVLLCTMTLCSQETKNVHDTSDTSNTPITCCFMYTSRQIPRKLVNDYYLTSSLCLQPAVIFQTKKGRKICADPNTTWVKEYIADLELEA